MSQWIWYAIGAMVLLSFSNLAFKLFAKENTYDVKALWPVAVLFGLAAIASVVYIYFVLKAQVSFTGLFMGILILSGLAVGLIFLSLQQGKVALVNAILSLSTVLVAVLSMIFLGDRFSAKEMTGLVLALLSLLFLVI